MKLSLPPNAAISRSKSSALNKEILAGSRMQQHVFALGESKDFLQVVLSCAQVYGFHISTFSPRTNSSLCTLWPTARIRTRVFPRTW